MVGRGYEHLSFFTDTCKWIASQSHGTKSERKEKIIKDDNVKKIARIKTGFVELSSDRTTTLN